MFVGDAARTARRESSSTLAWSLMVAACAAGCTLDKFEIVESLPCNLSSTRPECAPEAGTPSGQGGAGDRDLGEAGNAGSSGSDGSGGAPGGAGGGAGTMNVAVVNPPVRVVNKLDLLFMIDNSLSMRDKQNILGLVNTNLITALATPPCVPEAQGVGFGVGEPCPEGQTRAFQPITDIHIGIITSSLGDAGADVACSPAVPARVDMAHLLGTLPRASATNVAPDGFLSWAAGDDTQALTRNFQVLTQAVGEDGCGWEMSLESWYRFLIDPFPYRQLARVPCPGSDSTTPNCVQPLADANGLVELDEQLLTQRELFLRRDSLVAVVMLTDENDCSVEPGAQSWLVLNIEDSRPMFRGSSMCESNPNHPCCYICPNGVPEDCEQELDPVCQGVPSGRLAPEADGTNLRCFEQKRRFGLDFLYPTERYVNALKNLTLCPSSASLDDCNESERIPNPLYASGERTPDDVFLAGIIGVPWQDLAAFTDARGNPLEPNELRFRSAAELTPSDWAFILGEPHESPPIPPTDPYMQESATPRPGVTDGNAINGRDYVTITPISAGPDDLQYACIFPLPVPRDCSLVDPALSFCDCLDSPDTPLCEQTPGVDAPGSTQYWAKAYPGLRHLDVLRGYGANSIVASICAREVSPQQAGAPDFAYRPALSAVVERLQQRLGAR